MNEIQLWAPEELGGQGLENQSKGILGTCEQVLWPQDGKCMHLSLTGGVVAEVPSHPSTEML